MVVRSLIVFEYPVQVESQYMAEEAALICRLQRRLVCWWGESIQGQDPGWWRCLQFIFPPRNLWTKHIPLCLAKTQSSSRFWYQWFHLWLAKWKKARHERTGRWLLPGLRHQDLSSFPCHTAQQTVSLSKTLLNYELQLFLRNTSSW